MNQGLKIFLYHDVTNEPSLFARKFGLAVSLDLFSRQIDWIRKNFNVIHPGRLCVDVPLPDNAALITFDDGFYGTFANGVEHLEKIELPSVVFLNMQAIIEQRPLLSALASFRESSLPEFVSFAKRERLTKPFHLCCTPSLMRRVDELFGEVDQAAVIGYQGRFASLDQLRRFEKSKFVVYGNHLYDHWNATALKPVEFAKQYTKNQVQLIKFSNSAEIFAFPNGIPNNCFNESHVKMLKRLGAKKIFSGVGGINRNSKNYLLGRMTLNAHDSNEDILWCRLLRASFTCWPNQHA